MSYTLADVDEAERRIRAECPDVEIRRWNFGWSLSIKKRGGLWGITVFDSGEDRPTIMPHGDHDVDYVIKTINAAPRRRTMH